MPVEVVLYTRQGCHLCDTLKEELQRLAQRVKFSLKEIDIDTDSALMRQFNEDVPVVFIGHQKAFQYEMDEEKFLRMLRMRQQ